MTSSHPQFEPTAFSRPPRGEGRFALGVCAGLSRRWGLDVGLVRAVAFFGVLSVVGGFAYLAAAAVMPVDGEAREHGPRRSALGSAVGYAVRLAVWLVLAGLFAALGAVLTAFALPGVVLAAAAVLALAGFVSRERVPALAPMPLLAVAIALPAALVSLSNSRIDRSVGDLVVAPATPADLEPGATNRRGVGEVLVDLRGFRAADRSITQIKARSDLGRVVVALPRDRCFALRVKTARLGNLAQDGANLAARVATGASGTLGSGDDYAGSNGGTLSAGVSVDQESEDVSDDFSFDASPIWLSAYGRTVMTGGTWSRSAAGRPDAPTIELDLTSAAAAVVRDYPAGVDALDPNGGTAWPLFETSPPAPDQADYASTRQENRTPENRERWLRWERESTAWAIEQAREFAGACASREERASRWTLDPGTLQPWDPDRTPVREVNALGESHVIENQEDYR